MEFPVFQGVHFLYISVFLSPFYLVYQFVSNTFLSQQCLKIVKVYVSYHNIVMMDFAYWTRKSYVSLSLMKGQRF